MRLFKKYYYNKKSYWPQTKNKAVWTTYSWDDSDEKLWPVGSRARIGHAEGVGSVVPECGMKLVLKLSPPDALSTHPCARGVSGLDHEALHMRNHPFNSHLQSSSNPEVRLNTRQELIPWWHDEIRGRCNNRSYCGRRSSPQFWGI